MRTAIAAVTIALIVTSAAHAEDSVATPAIVTFDEIDHVYASGDVPPPGAFDRSLQRIAHVQARPRKRGFLDGAMRGLSVAGTQLDNAVSIVGASGQIGQTLHIASGAANLAPVANSLGLAGQGRLDTLVQTYVLPSVSPSGAQMLSGYLAAQQETAGRYSHASSAIIAAATPAAAPEQDGDAYARGSLRTYSIASTGRVRVDDPDAHVAIVFAPDIGKTFGIDDGNRTVHITAYDPSLSRPISVASHPALAGSSAPALRSRVESLPATTLGQTPATGFRTHVEMNVPASAGACTQATVTSDRVEYFAPIRIASTAANSSPFAPSDVHDSCAPTGAVVTTGTKIPADQLLMYQANAIERTTSAGTERYTLVIERGNLRTADSAPSAIFEIPDGYRQV